jgi:hypothetical protein
VPTPPPTVSAPALSRRTALAGAVALVTAGCTAGHEQAPRGTAQRRRSGLDPDVALAARVLTDEQALLDRVQATRHRHPQLAQLLAPVAASHGRHVTLLTAAVPKDARPSAAASPGAQSSPSASPAPATPRPAVRVPRHVHDALAVLARHEDRLGLVDKRSAFAARSGSFARIVASMAAAAAQSAAHIRSSSPARARAR